MLVITISMVMGLCEMAIVRAVLFKQASVCSGMYNISIKLHLSCLQVKMLSTLLALCVRNPPLTVWALSQHKDHLSMYGDFHYKDVNIIRLSYFYNGNSYTVKMASLYWDSPLTHWQEGILDCHLFCALCTYIILLDHFITRFTVHCWSYYSHHCLYYLRVQDPTASNILYNLGDS